MQPQTGMASSRLKDACAAAPQPRSLLETLDLRSHVSAQSCSPCIYFRNSPNSCSW